MKVQKLIDLLRRPGSESDKHPRCFDIFQIGPKTNVWAGLQTSTRLKVYEIVGVAWSKNGRVVWIKLKKETP